MARKRKGEEATVADNPITNYKDAVSSLLNGTGFEIVTEVAMLNDRPKIRTPLEVINCMLGGGIPFGVVMQSYGPPKAGKSSWLYQMMGKFQLDYPEGIAVIVDSESSAEGSRLSFLDVDLSRVLRLPASSIEAGFQSLEKMLDNKKKSEILKNVPVFVIWDTISKGMPQDSTTQSRMLAMDRARVIKGYLAEFMTHLEKEDFFLALINQVIYKTDSYGNTKADSGGGVALKHNVHMSTFLEANEREDVYVNNLFIKRVSYLRIDKSKIGPEMHSIPIVIDITQGGSVDEIASFTNYLMNQSYVPNSSGWYKFDEINKQQYLTGPELGMLMEFNKSYRYEDFLDLMKENPLVYNCMKLVLINRFSEIYKLQRQVIKSYKLQVIDELIEASGRTYKIWEMQRDQIMKESIDSYRLKIPFLKSNPFRNPEEVDEDMFYCSDCGSEYEDWSEFCINCSEDNIINGETYHKFCKELHSIEVQIPRIDDSESNVSTSNPTCFECWLEDKDECKLCQVEVDCKSATSIRNDSE